MKIYQLCHWTGNTEETATCERSSGLNGPKPNYGWQKFNTVYHPVYIKAIKGATLTPDKLQRLIDRTSISPAHYQHSFKRNMTKCPLPK